MTIPLTIWTIPRAFEGIFDVIQRNAVWSWQRLGAEVFFVGMASECATAAADMGIPWYACATSGRDGGGLPLVNDAIRVANERASHPLRVFANSDALFMDDLLPALEVLAERFPCFTGVGLRRDVHTEERIGTVTQLEALAEGAHLIEGTAAVDWFVYRGEGLWATMPAFEVGQAVYDNWMARAASEWGPLIDLTDAVRMLNQTHPTRPNFDWNRVERNRAAGGAELGSVGSANWKMTADRELVQL